MRCLCDTNIVSEVMRREPHTSVVEWLSGQAEVFLSVVTLEEIHCGLAYKDARRQYAWFERFVELRCQVLPVTVRITKRCGILRGQLRRKGTVRTQADLLIAATCLDHDLVLATRNERDFDDCGIALLNPFVAP